MEQIVEKFGETKASVIDIYENILIVSPRKDLGVYCDECTMWKFGIVDNVQVNWMWWINSKVDVEAISQKAVSAKATPSPDHF